MVYVIVEIDKNDVGEIVTRLLGAKHKITVVDDLRTACGCAESPKRRKAEPQPQQSVTVSSTKQIPLTTINTLTSNSHGGESGEAYDDEDDEMENEISLIASTALFDLFEEANLKPLPQKDGTKTDKLKNRRNNGVPYHPGTLCPQLRRGGSGDEEDNRDEYQEGVDMAIKCMVCTKIIALGTRPANYSTRKYAHARSHGFSDRFSCNLCHAVFKNKRSIYNHQKAFHEKDINFRIVDTWSEDSQRELMNMVLKCFPKTNKPFPKKVLMSTDEIYVPPSTQSLTDQLFEVVNQQESLKNHSI